MKTVNVIGAAAILSLSLITNRTYAIDSVADQQVEIKSGAAQGIQAVELKNGPLADFYELVAQNPKREFSTKRVVADKKADGDKAIENQSKDRLAQTEDNQSKRSLDKLPQHSAK